MIYLFYLLLAYLAYRFVFGFLIPVVRTTRQVRRSFRQMNEHMEQVQRGQQVPSQQASQPAAQRQRSQGDYIDFEEIKD